MNVLSAVLFVLLMQRRGRWKSASGSSRNSILTACAPSSAKTRSGRSSSECASSPKASHALCAPSSSIGRSRAPLSLLRSHSHSHSNSSGPHCQAYRNRAPSSSEAVRSWVKLGGRASAGRSGTLRRRGQCLHRNSDLWRALGMWTATSSMWRVSPTRGNRFE